MNFSILWWCILDKRFGEHNSVYKFNQSIPWPLLSQLEFGCSYKCLLSLPVQCHLNWSHHVSSVISPDPPICARNFLVVFSLQYMTSPSHSFPWWYHIMTHVYIICFPFMSDILQSPLSFVRSRIFLEPYF